MNHRPALIARIVAEHWRKGARTPERMKHSEYRLLVHVLNRVLDALNGETDPIQLAVEEGPDADAIRALVAGMPEEVKR